MLAQRVAEVMRGTPGMPFIQLFEGDAQEVEADVNTFLRATVDDVILEDIGYNYQGDEYQDGARIVRSSSHGVCLLLRRK